MAFKEEEYLQISGLQHFSFCRRQWAENLRTVDGRILHEKAHDGSLRERRSNLLITRDMSIHSPSLGIRGNCDVVEFHRGATGIPMPGQEGLWQPYPVEYKRGTPKCGSASALRPGYVSGGNALLRYSGGCTVLRRDSPPGSGRSGRRTAQSGQKTS